MNQGRNLDKAKKQTIYISIGLLVLLAWIILLISVLPDSPAPREWYMSTSEIWMLNIYALAMLATLVLLGITIGRYIEASLYQRNGHYLGKDDD